MIQGVVGRVFEKPFGNKTFFSFSVNGQDGFFGTGMKRPPAPGTSIKFNEKKNAKGYLEVDGSIEVLADGVPAPAGTIQNVGKNSGLGEGNRAGYWDLKNARDITNDAARELGASRNTAISIIDLALKNEAIKLPAAAKREEFLWTLLDKYTAKLMGRDESSDAAESEKEQKEEGNDDEWN
jgi:hypothetical protein